jgi:hypothetical protein
VPETALGKSVRCPCTNVFVAQAAKVATATGAAQAVRPMAPAAAAPRKAPPPPAPQKAAPPAPAAPRKNTAAKAPEPSAPVGLLPTGFGLVLALFPLGIPVLGLILWLMGGSGWLAFLAVPSGMALSGLCLLLARNPKTPAFVRLVIPGALGVGGYGFLIVLAVIFAVISWASDAAKKIEIAAQGINSTAPTGSSPTGTTQPPPMGTPPPQGTETPPSPPPPTPPPPPAPDAPISLARMKIGAAFGREIKFDKDHNTWSYRQNNYNGSLGILVTVEELPAGSPTTLDAFAAKFTDKGFIDPDRQYTEITEKGEVADGFFVIGKLPPAKPTGKPELGFVLVRNLNGARIRFRSTQVVTEPFVKESVDYLTKNVMLNTSSIFDVKLPGGWALTPDNVTLIVSQPDQAQLVYIDTVADKLIKKVDMDFKPGALAMQGDTLWAAAKGGAQVFALDAATGKVKKEFNTGGDAIQEMACDPKTGPIFASTASYKVMAIDMEGVTPTRARGHFLAVGPECKFLITGIQPPLDWNDFKVIEGPGGTIRVIRDTWGVRASMFKFTVEGKELKFAAAQNNAASNGWALHMSADGKRVGFVGGGGWRPPAGTGGEGGGYVVALFDTSDLKSMVGQAPHGLTMALHPVLNLGVTNIYGKELAVFNGKSLVKKSTITLTSAEERRASVLTFGGKGRKIIVWNGENVQNEQGLHLVRLDLTDEDKETLRKAYP